MKIKGKLLLYILVATVTLFLISIGYVSYNFRKLSKKNAQRIVEKEARIQANSFKASLDVDITITRTLSTVFESYKKIPRGRRIAVLNSMQRNLLKSSPRLIAIGTSWENYKFDSLHLNNPGRFMEGFSRDHGKIKAVKRNYTADTSSLYFKLKEARSELLLPYRENYTKRKGDDILVASIAVPILIRNQFHGLAGVDVALQRFQKQIEKVQPFEGSFGFVLSNNGQFIAHHDTSLIFKYIDSYIKRPKLAHSIREKIAKGEATALIYTAKHNGKNQKFYAYIAPIHLSKMEKPWAIGVSVPYSEVLYEANFNFAIAMLIGFFSLVLLSISTLYFAKRIIDPLKDTSLVVQELATGEIDSIKRLTIESKDEIGQIRESVNILVEALQRTANFAKEIGTGNFEIDYQRLSENDVLGNALLGMRANLKDAEEEDNKRAIQELKLNWSTEGIAKFGDILRDYQKDITKLSYQIISNLVRHIKAAQGGFYFTEPGIDSYRRVDLLAFYAFGEEQATGPSFEYGEGIIGEVVRKNEKVLLNDVPNSYVEVASGLGRANPRKFLVVPISNENGVYGALEINSFKEYEDFQIEFIEKLALNIASTLESMLANQRTELLLHESDAQKQQLEKAEEVLKKNLEKMEEAQRAMFRREAELESVLSALHTISPIAEYDMDGTIISANNVLLDLLEMDEEELIGRKQGSFQVGDPDEEFQAFWEDLRSGKNKEEIQRLRIGEENLWLHEAYTPILDETGKPYKVLNITTDITARTLMEQELTERKKLDEK